MVHIQGTIEEYRKRGAGVVAIVGQNPEHVREYLGKHSLPFPLLIDESREVIKAYGVHVAVNYESVNIARPANFILDPDGIIRYIFIGSRQTDFPDDSELYAAIEGVRARDGA